MTIRSSLATLGLITLSIMTIPINASEETPAKAAVVETSEAFVVEVVPLEADAASTHSIVIRNTGIYPQIIWGMLSRDYWLPRTEILPAQELKIPLNRPTNGFIRIWMEVPGATKWWDISTTPDNPFVHPRKI